MKRCRPQLIVSVNCFCGEPSREVQKTETVADVGDESRRRNVNAIVAPGATASSVPPGSSSQSASNPDGLPRCTLYACSPLMFFTVQRWSEVGASRVLNSQSGRISAAASATAACRSSASAVRLCSVADCLAVSASDCSYSRALSRAFRASRTPSHAMRAAIAATTRIPRLIQLDESTDRTLSAGVVA